MDKVRISDVLILCVLIFFTASIVGDEEDTPEKKPIKASLTERLTSLLYVFSPTPPSTTTSPAATTNWDKLKSLLNNVRAYFVPPNLDFRGSEENEAVSSGSSGEKVKEAVTRSLEKSKETVEDTAKSAAKIAGETVKKTKEKVKQSLSKQKVEPNQQSEL